MGGSGGTNTKEVRTMTETQDTNTIQTDFGWALRYLHAGKQVSRKGWNGPGQHIGLCIPSEDSDMTLPYIYIWTVQNQMVPWFASQTDLLAEDWYDASEVEVPV